MKKLFAITFLLISNLWLFCSANAEDGKSWVLVGAGAGYKCQGFIELYNRNPNTEVIFFHWAQGFMSGFNSRLFASNHSTTDLMTWSFDKQKEQIREFCQQNPNVLYFAAVVEVLNRMRSDQGLEIERLDRTP